MRGRQIGKLSVFLQDYRGNEILLWRLFGYQSNKWLQGQMPINRSNFFKVSDPRSLVKSSCFLHLSLGQTSNFSWDEPNWVSKVHELKSSTSGSLKFVWMSLDRPTRSIRLKQTDRTSEDCLLNKRRYSHAISNTRRELSYLRAATYYPLFQPRSGENL